MNVFPLNFRLKMSTETLIHPMDLLLKAISSGQQAWLCLWILEFPGLCASKQMLLIPLWVYFTLWLINSESLHVHVCGKQSNLSYRLQPALCLLPIRISHTCLFDILCFFFLIFLKFFQINTCNGFYCDQFTPNSKNKPKMWTENWSGW